jgi:hypothetical protein
VSGGALRGRSSSRVDDDMGGTGRPACIKELHGRGHGRGGVRSNKQDGLGFCDVGQWKGQSPINSERSVSGRGG